MSYESIIDGLLDKTVTIKRRSNTLNSLGDFSESWSSLGTGIRGTIQPVSVKELASLAQGQEFVATDKAYIPQDLSFTPVNGDKLLDESTSIEYEIVSVQKFKASKAGISSGHHYKLYLKTPRAPKS